MRQRHFSWTDIRALNGSQQAGFEQLCAQVAHEQTPVDAKFIRNGTPDGGVECYIVFPDGSEWGWQAKYFLTSFDDSQWGQLDESVKQALDKYPKLVKQTICVPYDFPDGRNPDQISARKRWVARVEKWKGWAKKKGRDVEFDLCGSHELLQELTKPKHVGRLRFWFDARSFDQFWFDARLAAAIRAAGPRYTPELNIDLPIAHIFDAVGRTPEFFDRVKSHARPLRDKLRTFGYREQREPPLSVALASKVDQISATTREILEQLGLISHQAIGLLPIAAVADLVDKATEAAHELGQELWNLNSKAAAEYSDVQGASTIREQREPYRALQSRLYSLQSELRSVGIALRQADTLSSTSLLLLVGEAGAGKTHLLCDIAKKRVETGRPTILLMGQMFTSTDSPWSQALRQLDLEGCSAEELVGALEAAAQVAGCRAIVLVDALNEGQGRHIWPAHLSAFLALVERSPWIAVALSIREAYEELVVPTTVRERALRKEHHGFSSHEYDATKAFFSYYGVEFPSTPLLAPEFRNPLFLRTLCEGLRGTGQQRLPRGFHGVSATFDLYLAAANQRLAIELDFHPKSRLVKQALEAFADALVSSDARWLSLEQAMALINSFLPGKTFQQSLYRGMVTEGMLLEEPRTVNDSSQDVVMIAYDRFADHMVAKILLDQYLDLAAVEKSFAPGSKLHSLWEPMQWVPPGLLEAICVQVPERTRQEVPDLLKSIGDGHHQLAGAFRTSLIWRSPESITEATRATLSRMIRLENDLHETLDVLLTLASLPGHPLNANFLDKRLRACSMPQRDSWWSTYLHAAWGDQGALNRIVDWAWSESGSAHLENEAASLVATALAWMLTTSNRYLRDRATKALVNLLTARVELCVSLVERFANVDDKYVVERVLAVAYGVAMRSQDNPGIETLARTVYRLVFESGSPPAHILLRDYARGTVERALFLGLAQECDSSLIRPPYQSQWPHIPSKEEIQHLLPNWEVGSHDSGDTQWSRNRIGNSIMDDDFAWYVIGTNSGRTNWLSLRLNEPAWEPPQTPQDQLNNLVSRLPSEAQAAWQAFAQADEDAGRATSSFARRWLDARKKASKGNDLSNQWGEIANQLRDDAAKNKRCRQLGKKREAAWARFCSFLDANSLANIERAIDALHARVGYAEPPRFDLSMIQRYILWRVFDLGWTEELFGTFDRYAVRMHGRSPSKAERIGKKYQWIAFHEILALIADHYQYRERFRDDVTATKYEGPWQESLRDIDPSSILHSTPGGNVWGGHVRNWWGDVPYEEWDLAADAKSWLKLTEDLPEIRDLLLVTRLSDGSSWVNLDGTFDWTQPTPADVETTDVPRRNVWFIATGYLIRQVDVDAFTSWARGVDFWGRWMPEPPELNHMFIGENLWSPAARYYQSAYYGDDGWTVPEYGCPVEVRTAAVEHLQEAGGFDCSVDETIRLRLPVKDLFDGLRLRWNGSAAGFCDPEGNLAAFDPTGHEPGPVALLVRGDSLLAYLKSEGLAIGWAVVGEKRVLGQERMGESLLSMQRMTGAYTMGPDGFHGFLRCIYDEPQGKRKPKDLTVKETNITDLPF